jgi:hypothetical protein
LVMPGTPGSATPWASRWVTSVNVANDAVMVCSFAWSASRDSYTI